MALRGAVTVESDDRRAIIEATERLITELLERNALAAGDLVSAVFTSTPDLTAEFPAAGARRAGLGAVPLLCATEMAVPGSLGRCIRVLVHAYSDRAPEELDHVYLGDARALRSDLSGEPGN